MPIETPENVTPVTEEQYENAQEIIKRYEEERRTRAELDRKKGWMTKEAILKNLEDPATNSSDYCYLEFAPPELRADKEVMLKVVARYGGALEYVSQELRNDREIVLAAIKSDNFDVRLVSPEMREDEEVKLELMRHQGRMNRRDTPIHRPK
jgi:hypothetical protein